MTQVIHVLTLLFFDRDAGRVRPSTLTGLGVVALAVASHFWLSEPWLEQAGFPTAAHSPIAAASRPALPALCGPGAGRR